MILNEFDYSANFFTKYDTFCSKRHHRSPTLYLTVTKKALSKDEKTSYCSITCKIQSCVKKVSRGGVDQNTDSSIKLESAPKLAINLFDCDVTIFFFTILVVRKNCAASGLQ